MHSSLRTCAGGGARRAAAGATGRGATRVRVAEDALRRAEEVVRARPEPRDLRRRARRDLEHADEVLVGLVVRVEADRHAQHALAAPVARRRDGHAPRLAALEVVDDAGQRPVLGLRRGRTRVGASRGAKLRRRRGRAALILSMNVESSSRSSTPSTATTKSKKDTRPTSDAGEFGCTPRTRYPVASASSALAPWPCGEMRACVRVCCAIGARDSARASRTMATGKSWPGRRRQHTARQAGRRSARSTASVVPRSASDGRPDASATAHAP